MAHLFHGALLVVFLGVITSIRITYRTALLFPCKVFMHLLDLYGIGIA